MRLSSFLVVVVVTLFATLAAAEESATIKNLVVDSNRILRSVEDKERSFSVSALENVKSALNKKWAKATKAFKKRFVYFMSEDEYKKKVTEQMIRNNDNFMRQ
ncbi:hypothetical protein PF005_g4801 [Phytophthora fragariae]|uniref:RxLR effector protein n=1 Tax=Phytophthora fragariae TaxID=53985 RepID=A0A6A4A0J0_9STRA|nr:hypothetical protein PF003_g2325 [Phytophthora fragariae]KAE8945215.1 hypothetical protein PF009_g5122 [Phytophthora fragariae]KAE9023754.1 hypothetical protein PF011_g3844 [Phytophthora fragariae]KAE9123667.1 hypothetical protein PF007_g6978 [Phytophthora fragariae]KAE9129708.1 hypothetical protein PF010_g4107 [Phytophthora fragariae]